MHVIVLLFISFPSLAQHKFDPSVIAEHGLSDENRKIEFNLIAFSQRTVYKFVGADSLNVSFHGYDYFNKQGQIVGSTRNYGGGKIELFQYDNCDSLIRYTVIRGAKCKTIYVMHYLRDSTSRLIEKWGFEYDQFIEQYEDCDDCWNWSTWKKWEIDYFCYYKYQHDTLWNKLERRSKSDQDLYHLILDSSNQVQSITSFLGDKSIYYRKIYSRGDSTITTNTKNVVDGGFFDHHEQNFTTVYSLDKNKNIIQRISYDDSIFHSQTKFFYDSHNRRIKYEIYNDYPHKIDLGYVYRYLDFKKPKKVISVTVLKSVKTLPGINRCK
ncbi:MAG: hypothetical protein JKY54_15015 [Flavobacteriales bacterium]|nr:hypothetical protein [Flavobacteriales bacterium]